MDHREWITETSDTVYTTATANTADMGIFPLNQLPIPLHMDVWMDTAKDPAVDIGKTVIASDLPLPKLIPMLKLKLTVDMVDTDMEVMVDTVARGPHKANKFKTQLGLEARHVGDSQQMQMQRLIMEAIMDTMTTKADTKADTTETLKLETLMDTEAVSMVKKNCFRL